MVFLVVAIMVVMIIVHVVIIIVKARQEQGIGHGDIRPNIQEQ